MFSTCIYLVLKADASISDMRNHICMFKMLPPPAISIGLIKDTTYFPSQPCPRTCHHYMYFGIALPAESAYMPLCRPVFVFQLIKDETLKAAAFPLEHTKAFVCCSICTCCQGRQDRVILFLGRVLREAEISRSRACARKQETRLSSPLYSVYEVSMEAVGGSWLTSCNTTTERF